MDVQRWLARQEPQWQRLEALLKKAEAGGLKRMSAPEVQELSGLYRLVSADLARAQARQAGQVITEQLLQLTRRSYAQIYQGGRRQEGRRLLAYLSWGFPAVIQASWIPIAIATTVFMLSYAVGWWYTWRDPVFIEAAIPPHIVDLVQEQGELWMGSIVGIEPLASTHIMQNNISVTFSAFAGGMFAGLWTLFILALNGLHIGAIATLVGQNNLAYPFWAFVFPHGSLELPAIFFAGGAGLLLAQGLVFPGQYKRLDALRMAAGKAIQIMFGVVPMLVLAGLIEGFFSPSPLIPDAVKYLVGISLFWGLIAYLRRQQPQPDGD